MIEDPYKEGYKAFNRRIEENPYPLFSPEWYEWEDGYMEAEDELFFDL